MIFIIFQWIDENDWSCSFNQSLFNILVSKKLECRGRRVTVIAGNAMTPWVARWSAIMVWASFQIRKRVGCACAGNARNVFFRHRFQRKPLVSDPGMYHDKCVSHVPGCMSGSLSRCGGGKRSRHSWLMRNPQFYVSGKRPIGCTGYMDPCHPWGIIPTLFVLSVLRITGQL